MHHRNLGHNQKPSICPLAQDNLERQPKIWEMRQKFQFCLCPFSSKPRLAFGTDTTFQLVWSCFSYAFSVGFAASFATSDMWNTSPSFCKSKDSKSRNGLFFLWSSVCFGSHKLFATWDCSADFSESKKTPLLNAGSLEACPHLRRTRVYRMISMSAVFHQSWCSQNLRISTTRMLGFPFPHHVLSAPRAPCLAVGVCKSFDQISGAVNEVVDSGQPLQFMNSAIRRMRQLSLESRSLPTGLHTGSRHRTIFWPFQLDTSVRASGYVSGRGICILRMIQKVFLGLLWFEVLSEQYPFRLYKGRSSPVLLIRSMWVKFKNLGTKDANNQQQRWNMIRDQNQKLGLSRWWVFWFVLERLYGWIFGPSAHVDWNLAPSSAWYGVATPGEHTTRSLAGRKRNEKGKLKTIGSNLVKFGVSFSASPNGTHYIGRMCTSSCNEQQSRCLALSFATGLLPRTAFSTVGSCSDCVWAICSLLIC